MLKNGSNFKKSANSKWKMISSTLLFFLPPSTDVTYPWNFVRQTQANPGGGEQERSGQLKQALPQISPPDNLLLIILSLYFLGSSSSAS